MKDLENHVDDSERASGALSSTVTVQADLVMWSEYPHHGDRRIRGAIFNDSKGRFADGTFVITSPVVSCAGGILQTRNTTYRLIPENVCIEWMRAGFARLRGAA